MTAREMSRPAPPLPGHSPTCQYLIHQAKNLAGGWEELRDRVPINPSTGYRKPGLTWLKRLGKVDGSGFERISPPETLWGLMKACEGLADDDRFSIDAWVAAQRETLRQRGLEDPTVAPLEVADLDGARAQRRRASKLEVALRRLLAGLDTHGFTERQIGEVTGLIRHFAAGTGNRRGA